MRRLSFVGLSFTLFACSYAPNSNQYQSAPSPEPPNSPPPVADATPRPFDAKLDIGVVVAGLECSELLIRNNELRPGDEVQVVWADDRPHKKLLARVYRANGCPRSTGSGIEQIVVDDDESAPSEYEIQFTDQDEASSGFGVLSAKATVEIVKETASLTASNLHKPLFFRVCSGNESYHMTIWEGKPLIGKRVWYSYMSLSYDTDPTCKSADFE